MAAARIIVAQLQPESGGRRRNTSMKRRLLSAWWRVKALFSRALADCLLTVSRLAIKLGLQLAKAGEEAAGLSAGEGAAAKPHRYSENKSAIVG